MPLNASIFANLLNQEVNKLVDDDDPFETPEELKAFTSGLVGTLRSATVTLKKVTGTAPPVPGPVSNLASDNGFITISSVSAWTNSISQSHRDKDEEPPDSKLITDELQKHVNYITSAAVVVFKPGVLLGTSTAAPGPPIIPGVLVAGGGVGGQITGLSGSDWASSVIPEDADSDYSERIFTAMSNYIMNNAVVTFNPNTVNGTFSSPGSQLVGGVGASGFIT